MSALQRYTPPCRLPSQELAKKAQCMSACNVFLESVGKTGYWPKRHDRSVAAKPMKIATRRLVPVLDQWRDRTSFVPAPTSLMNAFNETCIRVNRNACNLLRPEEVQKRLHPQQI